VIDPIFVAEIDQVAKTLEGVLVPNDVVLTLGAGSIGATAAALPDYFATLEFGAESADV